MKFFKREVNKVIFLSSIFLGFISPVNSEEFQSKFVQQITIPEGSRQTYLPKAFLGVHETWSPTERLKTVSIGDTISGSDYGKKKNEFASKIEWVTAPAENLPFEDGSFDPSICAGTFTCGHVGPEALYEMVRITKQGGFICFTVRKQEWEASPCIRIIKDIEKTGSWIKLEHNTCDYNVKEGVSCQLCLYQVN